jgi:hypothetical protein
MDVLDDCEATVGRIDEASEAIQRPSKRSSRPGSRGSDFWFNSVVNTTSCNVGISFSGGMIFENHRQCIVSTIAEKHFINNSTFRLSAAHARHRQHTHANTDTPAHKYRITKYQ